MMEQKPDQPVPGAADKDPLPPTGEAYTSPEQPPQPKPTVQETGQPLAYAPGQPAVYPGGQPGPAVLRPLTLEGGAAGQPSQKSETPPWQKSQQGPRPRLWASVTAWLLLLILLLASLLLLVGFRMKPKFDEGTLTIEKPSKAGSSPSPQSFGDIVKQMVKDGLMVDLGDVTAFCLSVALWESLLVVRLAGSCVRPSGRLLAAEAIVHGLAVLNLPAFLAFSVAMALDADDKSDGFKYYVPLYATCHVIAAVSYALAFVLALASFAGFVAACRRWRDVQALPAFSALPVQAAPPVPLTHGHKPKGAPQPATDLGAEQPGQPGQTAAGQGQGQGQGQTAGQPGQKAQGLEDAGKEESRDPQQKEGTKDESREAGQKEGTRDESREPAPRKDESRGTKDERTKETDQFLGHLQTG